MSVFAPICNTQSPAPQYEAFTKIRQAHPETTHGNRCGHQPSFNPLPRLKADGSRLKVPAFIATLESRIHSFFQHPYPILFKMCPELKAAHGAKSGIMRSEQRESLSHLATALARNLDLTTLAVLEHRTLTEIYRFTAQSLTAENQHLPPEHHRRTSPNRLFASLNLLRDAGLINYHLPKATQISPDQWQAAPAAISFTHRFWELLGISTKQRNQVKTQANHDRQKNPTPQDKANYQVAQRRIKRLNAKIKHPTPNPLRRELNREPAFDLDLELVGRGFSPTPHQQSTTTPTTTTQNAALNPTPHQQSTTTPTTTTAFVGRGFSPTPHQQSATTPDLDLELDLELVGRGFSPTPHQQSATTPTTSTPTTTTPTTTTATTHPLHEHLKNSNLNRYRQQQQQAKHHQKQIKIRDHIHNQAIKQNHPQATEIAMEAWRLLQTKTPEEINHLANQLHHRYRF